MFKHLNTTEEVLKHIQENTKTNTTQEVLYKNNSFFAMLTFNTDHEDFPAENPFEMNLDQVKKLSTCGYHCRLDLFENCFAETIKECTPEGKIIKVVKYKISFTDASTLEIHLSTPEE